MRPAFPPAVLPARPLGLLLMGLILAAASLPAAQGQTQTLTLQQCLDIALDQNLDVASARLNERSAEADLLQSKMNYLPSANASVDYRINLGTTFDFVTFSRISQTTRLSNPSLSFSQNLFNGLANLYTLQRNQAEVQRVRESRRRVENDLIANVLLAYLNYVFDVKALEQIKTRIAVLEAQVERTQNLYNAGVVTQADVLNIQSSIALEKTNQVRTENRIEQDRLQLLQLLQLDLQGDYQFVEPDSSELKAVRRVLEPVDVVVLRALEFAPEVQQAKWSQASAQAALRRARADYYPSLNFNLGLSSNYSSNGGEIVQADDGTISRIRTKFFEQIDDNFATNISFRLNIPIFNNLQVRTAVTRARISLDQAELNRKRALNTVSQKVQQAYLDVKASGRQIDALEEQQQALNEAFRQTEVQYNNGRVDFYAYNEALNNRQRARLELVQARYDYYLKRKVLDFYQGQPITF